MLLQTLLLIMPTLAVQASVKFKLTAALLVVFIM